MSRIAGFSSPLLLGFDELERVLARATLHRGIAARQFQRAFVLAEGIEVSGANLENGLLEIDLIRIQPERIIRKISIKSGSDKE